MNTSKVTALALASITILLVIMSAAEQELSHCKILLSRSCRPEEGCDVTTTHVTECCEQLKEVNENERCKALRPLMEKERGNYKPAEWLHKVHQAKGLPGFCQLHRIVYC